MNYDFKGIEISRDSRIFIAWERVSVALKVKVGGEEVIAASGRLHLRG